MGYLNNSVLTVDTVLTTKGREALAKGDGSFKITQVAFSDDEIDYTLYNPSHPSGSDFYGEAIENMPLLEAIVDESQTMKYKLTTLPRGTSKLPILDIGQSSLVLRQGAAKSITPQTLNYLGATNTYETNGYTVLLADSRVASSFTGTGINTEEVISSNSNNITLGTNISKTVIGTTISIIATTVNTLFGTNQQLQTTLTVIGRDSGARVTIPVTITKLNN
jgi:hypothetical protein